jgi:hypothetical protein
VNGGRTLRNEMNLVSGACVWSEKTRTWSSFEVGARSAGSDLAMAAWLG